ncbi:MAG: diguanylate cyclase [Pseudanabaenaceae cyanobacterium SKYGB_i_bin29]|nr:diguanylate cyclase [Pseudanabaenaceae cyanobacterium SKYG29]MDW8422069.1 diguanylate cyclase [Pseudanabaenaceae cyanobacterium SKYGB_i_bin29]
MESEELMELRAENQMLRQQVEHLTQENQTLREMERHLLEALELALMERYDLETMLEVMVSHADTVEQELFSAISRAWEAAGIDELTQLPNRRQLLEYLDRIWRQMMRQGLPLSLLVCDVDHFKSFNDFYGHQAGDECLQQVAQAIAQSIRRPIDLASRYGGEEFVVVLPNTPLQGAWQVAESMRMAVKYLAIPHAGSSVTDRVTISVGLATQVPQRGTLPMALLQKADKALFQAKRLGRDRVEVAF